MAKDDKLKAGLEALSGGSVPKKADKFSRVPNEPRLIRFIFKCKQCGKVFPIEDIGFRTAMSMDHAQELLAAFAKTVEPRTIICSCSHEAEYQRQDVGFFWE
jgi:hypothetical protein